MLTSTDAPVKSMTEYHQRYSRGLLIHLGWEAYCRDCGKAVRLPSSVVTRQEVRQRLLDIGWLPERVEGCTCERWLCPSCHLPFTRKEVPDAETGFHG